MKKTKKSKKSATSTHEDFFRQDATWAADGKLRYVTTVLIFTEFHIRYGISISTENEFDTGLGRRIAGDRARLQRGSVLEKGLCGSLTVHSSHMNWLKENRKLMHKYADYLQEQALYNINDIIWPK